MNIESDVLESHFISNGFIRQGPDRERCLTWRKPGFARFPPIAPSSKLHFDLLDHSAVTQANTEFSELLRIVFHDSDAIGLRDFEFQLFACCPPLFDQTSKIAFFDTDPITREDFARFYSHFGPGNSLMAKYCQFRDATSVFPSLRLGENNSFHFLSDAKPILIYNNPIKEIGQFFLYGSKGLSVNSWSHINRLALSSPLKFTCTL
jgi:hypothetical protein